MSGWDASAQAWIDVQGADGDFGRVHVLDAPMLALVDELAPASVLDVGCGEGRFCRMLAARGMATCGIDPTTALIDRARALHPDGDYRVEPAGAMTVGQYDLVVCYLSLIDMPDLGAALARIVAAIRPGGHLLIANLTAFNTAAVHLGWVKPLIGEPSFPIDHYLEERPRRTAWRGIDITNHHRPLKSYMQALLGHGLVLTHFDEPPATGGPADKRDRYNRVPNFHIMLWRKP
ncbi:SAM-dependent methyltransferase [Sandarakinorhabdus cyanobacteriorum]|uniref:SAM-dependent methyltransferase n=1 Tax=Sandarakinorhabdus cyanobacteriorum TaxID=1981098 RepID=A0A255YFJ7_9SPHN|nr:class I SAM-dependent methyltransferase [Sandarakinorhabdus cyanobacteriorum]OYQ27250.1 SAM-dependent methyltransferase [Sandarakinorhabdus cyanobacteriorum]